MTRVIHTGDTHVGYRQYHSAERRRDFLAALERVVEDAVADDVDAVVHAGDLFHDRRPDLEDLLGTIDVLSALRDADIPLLAVVGNHEGTQSTQWLDLFETLGLATRLGREPTVVGDTAFYGLDFVPRSRRDDLAYDFVPAAEADADARRGEGAAAPDHAALVAHGRFTPFAHADWETEEVLAASPVDFDAVLLGDVHDPGRETVDGTPVTYCGSTERASADERAPRGYNIVSFDPDDGVHISRRGIETREFVFVDVDLAADEGTERVRERVREEAVEDAVVVVTLEGAGDTVQPAAVEQVGEEHGALLTRVNDRRERGEDGDAPAVEFADPDEAVRERLREMGLSEAARDVDERVRDREVPKTGVRDAVAGAVRDRLDDPAAFEPGQAGEVTDAVTEAEPTGDGGGGHDGGASDEAGREGSGERDTDEPGAEDDGAAAEPAGEKHADPRSDAAATVRATDDTGGDDEGADGQSTVGEFL